MLRVGLEYSPVLGAWLEDHFQTIDCLEVRAEDCAKSRRRLEILARKQALIVRDAGLSLGTPGPLRADHLLSLAQVVESAGALSISTSVAFNRSSEIDLGFPNPISPGDESLRLVADHARQVMDMFRIPLLLENLESHFLPRGSMKETAFLNQLSEATGCGLLLDLTAILVNGRNHGFSATSWLREIEPHRIDQVRVGNWVRRDGQFSIEPQDRIAREAWALLEQTLSRARPKVVILEYGTLRAADEVASRLEEVRAMAAKQHRTSRKVAG